MGLLDRRPALVAGAAQRVRVEHERVHGAGQEADERSDSAGARGSSAVRREATAIGASSKNHCTLRAAGQLLITNIPPHMVMWKFARQSIPKMMPKFQGS